MPGQGIKGMVDGVTVVLGTARFMESLGLDASFVGPQLDALRRDGKIALLAAIGGKLAGVLAMADRIKPSARDALGALRRRGIDVVMATGDNRITADAVARELGITSVHADVLPEDKARIVSQLKAEGRTVAMAGDGVNDAPALAAADVGIAMGGGADVALESAGITLLKGDLAGIVRARRLAEATVANIRQNLAFAFGYNALGIPVAAGVLYPDARRTAVADGSCRCHEPVVGLRGRQCPASGLAEGSIRTRLWAGRRQKGQAPPQ